MKRPKVRPKRIVQTSLGCHVENVLPLRADPDDVNSNLNAVYRRMARPLLPVDRKLAEELKTFTRKFLVDNFKPFESGINHDDIIISWIWRTNYPLWRKIQLYNIYMKTRGPWLDKFKRVKRFIKRETYSTYKYPRNINARCDEAKVRLGPYVKMIEEVMYKLEWFIKHIPVPLRPVNLMKICFEGAYYYETDYESFECLLVKELMEATEMQLYEFFYQNYSDVIEMFRTVLCGINRCESEMFDVEVESTRMSGEMSTSLGNGFFNLMVFLFVCSKSDVKTVKGRVEGDDGGFATDRPILEELFQQLGLRIKIVKHVRVETMKFCQMTFDPVELRNITDPLQEIIEFGWTGEQYVGCSSKTRLRLLRVKALSLAYQYPGCPILGAVARYGLRVTRSIDVRHHIKNSGTINEWERQILIECIQHPVAFVTPGPRTRLLMEEQYGISVQSQLMVENYFESLSDLRPLQVPILEFPVTNYQHYSDHVIV